mmetsp:Transcript_31256/g.93822  ORF Transcript_31256/g.93822 Transcript_31256/m.93822 type:complete len:203 (-) Transcript_31256:230-838(-)
MMDGAESRSLPLHAAGKQDGSVIRCPMPSSPDTERHLRRLSFEEDRRRAEVEHLQEVRVNAMRAQIADLQADLDTADATLAALTEENAMLTQRVNTLTEASNDLRQILAAPPASVEDMRRTMGRKYGVVAGVAPGGGVGAGAIRGGMAGPATRQPGDCQPRRARGLAESTLLEVAGRLDGMVRRAEEGRTNISALRAAVHKA